MADPDYLSKLTVVPALPSYALSSAAKRINSSVQLIGDPISDENEAIAMAAGTTGSLRHPKVVVTSSFGRRKVKGGSVYHKGIDIRAPLNTYVYAPDDAVMQPHDHHKGLGWGKMAILKCKDGTLLRFAHLNRILIASGTAVRAGTIIAQTGMTGTSAPHLHFEYLPRGIGAVNPLNDPKKRYLKIL
jgi:murein DD-endopeptidase MepM/ murein hydrolase activator NlpD